MGPEAPFLRSIPPESLSVANSAACKLAPLVFSMLALALRAQSPDAARPDAAPPARLRLPRQGLELEVRKHVDRFTGAESVTAALPEGAAADYFAALRTELTLARLPAL